MNIITTYWNQNHVKILYGICKSEFLTSVKPEVHINEKTIGAVIGQPFFTDCRATGYPSPRVQWTENSTVVPQIQVSDSYSILVIQNVTSVTYAIYTCWANVSYGSLILQANESFTLQPYGRFHHFSLSTDFRGFCFWADLQNQMLKNKVWYITTIWIIVMPISMHTCTYLKKREFKNPRIMMPTNIIETIVQILFIDIFFYKYRSSKPS